MRIREIAITGFKSYPNTVNLADLSPTFNSVTGLNGSGKSNILDAICFVLCPSNKDPRIDKYQDLIYKQGHAGVTQATVTITFELGRGNLETLSRTVSSGKSQFHLNQRPIPQHTVLDWLRSHHLEPSHWLLR